MTRKRLIALGFSFPETEINHMDFDSDHTLIDSDIVIVSPSFGRFQHQTQPGGYRGEPLIKESRSPDFVRRFKHWQSEFKSLFLLGKTVIIFLYQPHEVFAYTGGTSIGKDGNEVKLVEPVNTYKFLGPSFPSIISVRGSTIIPAKDMALIGSYWRNFSKYSAYEAYIKSDVDVPLLTTPDTSRVVAATVRMASSSVVILPPISLDYSSDPYRRRLSTISVEERTTLGSVFIDAVIQIDRALHGDKVFSQVPGWSLEMKYSFAEEEVLKRKLDDIDNRSVALQEEKTAVLSALDGEGSLRALLYGTGHLLESAILDALHLLGFQAEHYVDDESEFDAVFVSQEGRFLGEAEGRENASVNIDKLRQLKDNLDADYARDEISEYAKGVLFGNAYRLTEPEKRQEFFTQKCISSAKQAGIALVRTPDLFVVAKYLKENSDPDFAAQCRRAIKNAAGEIVQFPSVPVTD